MARTIVARTKVARTKVGRSLHGTPPPVVDPPTGGGGETSAPVISSVQASVLGSTSVRISWTTDQTTTGVVDYGTTTSYTTSSADVGPGTSLTVDITGLSSGTTYYFRIWAINSANLFSSSPNATFATESVGVQDSTIEGFGAAVTGGASGSTVHVTTLANSGAGSLRAALTSGSDKNIVFDVGGTIDLSSNIDCNGSNITIDGSTAPSPGITITGYGLRWASGTYSNILIKSIRHRGPKGSAGGYGVGSSEQDCVSFVGGASGSNITDGVIDHCSFSGTYASESVSIYRVGPDWTISNCIFGPGYSTAPDGSGIGHNYALTIGADLSSVYHPTRVSVHRNIFYGLYYRSPAVQYHDDGSTSPEVSADIENNLIYNYGYAGSVCYFGAKVNYRYNYYGGTGYVGGGSLGTQIEVTTGSGGATGQAYRLGNRPNSGTSANSGSAFTPAPSTAVSLNTDTVAMATALLSSAGCRVGGLDATDQGIINAIIAGGLPA